MVSINPNISKGKITSSNHIENLSQPQRTLFALQFQADNKKYPLLVAEVEAKYREGVLLFKSTYLFYESKKSYNDAVPTAYFNHQHLQNIPDLFAIFQAQEKENEFIYRDDAVHFLSITLMMYHYDLKEYTPKKKLLPFDLKIFVIPGIKIKSSDQIDKIYLVAVYVADRREGIFSHPHQVYCETRNLFPKLKDITGILNSGKAWIEASLQQNLYKS